MQLPQIGNVRQGCRPLGLHGRLLGFQGGHFVRNGGVGLGGLGLIVLQQSQLASGFGQFFFVKLNFRLLGGIPLPVAAVPGSQGLPLPAGRTFRLLNGAEQNFMLLLLAFQPKNLILRLPQLIPGGGKLEFHLVALPPGLLQIGLQHLSVFLELLFLEGQLFQFVGPGENARVLIDGAAGHGAAGVHDLAVQGDDFESVMVLLRHGDGRVHVLDNHRPTQKVLHNAPVGILGFHQLGGDAHKAPAVLQACLL